MPDGFVFVLLFVQTVFILYEYNNISQRKEVGNMPGILYDSGIIINNGNINSMTINISNLFETFSPRDITLIVYAIEGNTPIPYVLSVFRLQGLLEPGGIQQFGHVFANLSKFLIRVNSENNDSSVVSTVAVTITFYDLFGNVVSSLSPDDYAVIFSGI